ncbi:hypothetical protein [Hymenobacter wooponensis]|uniref:Uncharacterized protein n=1 Tax=Hymenobacter wooponensis TaxID=1525360 RepID=A0A4Z0MJZ2_9BACT|nr:hypothetical protein [Hymenobacter wooponensis]TGD79670.1 hypothetical protein EU557_15745 [Hymenobacter wooponensis]
MKTMLTLAPTATLHLHLVPAGRRLDFPTPAGQFAYVYRRGRNQSWQCVARNACSPYLDRTSNLSATTHEYMVQYLDTNGEVIQKTSIVRAAPAGLPVSPSWISLR